MWNTCLFVSISNVSAESQAYFMQTLGGYTTTLLVATIENCITLSLYAAFESTIVMCLQVQRVEEEHDVFALVVGEFDILELSVDNGGAGESGRWFLELRHRHDRCCFVATTKNTKELSIRSREVTFALLPISR